MEQNKRVFTGLKEANKYYGKSQVLKNVTLDIQKGTILGLIGPSGAGKTTIIKCLLGMEKLNSGIAEIFGKKIPNRKILGEVGYMGQNDALYEELSAQENVQFFGNMLGLSHVKLQEAMDQTMQLVHLEQDLHKIVKTYSGGMKRRLSLAIALLADPALVVLDEPTVGIDPKLRLEIWDQLGILAAQGKLIVVTTHVMSEAEQCDQIGLIMEGRLLEFGTPEELKEKYNVQSIEEVFLKAEAKTYAL